MPGMDVPATPAGAPARDEVSGSPPRDRRGRRLVDFADPAVWAWIAVIAMLALPAAATLA
jgi:hypothetical protein